jgi:hypothetical protein
MRVCEFFEVDMWAILTLPFAQLLTSVADPGRFERVESRITGQPVQGEVVDLNLLSALARSVREWKGSKEVLQIAPMPNCQRRRRQSPTPCVSAFRPRGEATMREMVESAAERITAEGWSGPSARFLFGEETAGSPAVAAEAKPVSPSARS